MKQSLSKSRPGSLTENTPCARNTDGLMLNKTAFVKIKKVITSGGQVVEFSVLKRVSCTVINILRRFERDESCKCSVGF